MQDQTIKSEQNVSILKQDTTYQKFWF